MTLTMIAEPPPLTTDADGSVRVAGTRVLLDVVVRAFREGASAERIAEEYPALKLEDVYATLHYYLRNTAAVDAYLAQRLQEAEQIRADVAKHSNPATFPRILSRAKKMGLRR